LRLVAALVETASVYCVSSVCDVDSIDLQACLSDHSDRCLSTSSDVMATWMYVRYHSLASCISLHTL